MRNLKKLLAVIVAICVLATFTVPAFAEEAVKTDAEICADLKVLEGTTSGVDAEYLAKGTSRIQAVIISLRLAGKEDEALAFEGTENFADADEVQWAGGKAALAYVKANPELGWAGSTSGNFFPYEAASAQMIYKVLLEGLGYKQGTDFEWADVIEFAEGKGLVKVADVAKLTNNDVAIAIVEALKANVKDSEATLAETLVEAGAIDKAAAIEAGLYSAELTATVAATGAKKMTVTFNQPVDSAKAVIVAARGSIKPTIKSVTFAEDKKSAVVEFNTTMVAGDYTVTVSGLTEEALTAAVKVEAEKLTKIEFKSGVAVVATVSATVDKVTTSVIAENQYGEDVTSKLASANITASKGTGATISKEVITVTGDTGDFKVDETIVITVVDSATGVVATKTLTIAKAVGVETIEFGELTTDDEDLAKESVNVANMTSNASDYYIPVVIKDQYGNTLDSTQLAGVTVVSSNKSIVKTNGFDDNDDGTFIVLVTPDATITHGTAVITVIAAGTGKTANTTVVVKENGKIDTLTLEVPASTLKLTKATELPLTIIDTYGEEVALADTTEGGTPTNITLDTNTSIGAIGATLDIVTDYVKDKDILKITPTAKNITLTVVTATGKSQVLSLTAVDAPVVTSIKGIDPDVATILANDVSLNVDLEANVIFLDQYGEEIAAPAFDDDDDVSALDFTIKEESGNAVTTYDAATGVVSASVNAGSETYKVILKDGATELDELEVKFTVVDANKITEFGVEDLNKIYTGAISPAHNQQIKVYGLSSGKKVVVNQNMIKGASADSGLTGFDAGGLYTAKVIDTEGKDVAAKVTVLVANADKTYVINKDVVYSSAAPKASELVIKYDGDVVAGGAIVVPFAELNESFVVDTGSLLQFVAKDQYKVQREAAAFNFVITNNETAGGVVSATGTGSTFVTGDAGDSLQFNVFVDGLYKTIKVFVE